MGDFMNLLNETITDEKENGLVETENGALSYKSSGSALVDLNYATASLRSADPETICQMFEKAYDENNLDAVLWLFYASDVREGMGERRLFRILFKDLAIINKELAINLIYLVPEYSRWDNLWPLLEDDAVDEDVKYAVYDRACGQLIDDMKFRREGKPISLLAKWMPSNNTSSKRSRALAKKFEDELQVTPRKYRKMLSALRKYLDLVETHISKNDWPGIDYEKVPSRANIIYKDAFMRHDEERRTEYLESLEKGETKINGSVNFPHDVVQMYIKANKIGRRDPETGKDLPIDPAIESLWKALPDYVEGDASTLVIADSSGSMTIPIGGTTVTAMVAAYALGIYFAERLKGPFHNRMITFSENPEYIKLPGTSLLANLNTLFEREEVANTNIEKTMALILRTAVENNLSQDELPKNILILSDGEFDYMADLPENNSRGYWGATTDRRSSFDGIIKKFEEAGYKMPKLTFWNLNSRTRGIPVRENELGVNLVSGFSPAVVKLVLTGKTDPHDALMEILNSKRYYPIIDIFRRTYNEQNAKATVSPYSDL